MPGATCATTCAALPWMASAGKPEAQRLFASLLAPCLVRLKTMVRFCPAAPAWALFFLGCAGLNWYVAAHYDEAIDTALTKPMPRTASIRWAAGNS